MATPGEPPYIWGPWVLDCNRMVLEFYEKPDQSTPYYEVDLETCKDAAEVLDWIIQLSSKYCLEDEAGDIITPLVKAFEELLDPQANLCSGGKNKVVNDPRSLIMKRGFI